MTFNIGDEFRVTTGMENGEKVQLSDNAYIKIRCANSKTYIKALQEQIEKLPEAATAEDRQQAIIKSVAKIGIVDCKNITILW